MEMWTKESIRSEILKKRRCLGEYPELEAKKNQVIRQKAMQCPLLQTADAIFLYASIRHEADTWELAREWIKEGRRLAYPRVKGKEMEFYWIASFSDLEPGAMKILEPVAGCEQAIGTMAETAPMVVPGVAFDREGYRLGYGGGYYDKYLERYPKHPTIGLAFDFQILEQIPREVYDWKMDRVLTDEI